MAKKTNDGVVDTKNMPSGKPSGIASAMSIPSPLESGVDITDKFGADKRNPLRGLRAPKLGPHRPR
jgi:hypothetical protein